jgi:rsbT co-antagonist protein RsbR
MQIDDLDERLRRLTTTLAQLLAGEFDAIDMRAEFADDLLGRVEETLMFLVMDIKTIALANRDKEAALLLQQAQLAENQRELAAKLETIDRQAVEIRQLSTPILEVWKDILVVPIVGIVDSQRSVEILADLLGAIARMHTKWVILDITGVAFVDTATADRLLSVVRAAALLGTRCLLSGIQPAVAQTLVALGVDLGEVESKRNLADALRHCLLRVNHEE